MSPLRAFTKSLYSRLRFSSFKDNTFEGLTGRIVRVFPFSLHNLKLMEGQMHKAQEHPDAPLLAHAEELIAELEAEGYTYTPPDEDEDGEEWEDEEEDGEEDVAMS